MKILMCHNYYQQRGGEDQSFEDEAAILELRGHEVIRYTRHNDELHHIRPWTAASQTIWSRPSYRDLRKLIAGHRPDLVHFTNTFPLISPSAYYAAGDEGVPVVQALHNYRALCPDAKFFRRGRVCEDCLGKRVPWPGVIHRCYRQSLAASAVVATLSAVQQAWKVWQRTVDRFYTLSEFARRKFVEGGLPGKRIDVKPNSVHPDPGVGDGRGGYAVFVGRLSPEKGLRVLVDAWKELRAPLRLKIVGDGPLAEQARRAAACDPRIDWLGSRSLEEVCRIVGRAACLVIPSVWFETFGRTVIEAFAVGTPVIASRLGAVAELVEDGRTGLHFAPGDSRDLASKVRRLLDDAPGLEAMRGHARREYELKYTPDANGRALEDIFHRVLGSGEEERSQVVSHSEVNKPAVNQQHLIQQ